MAYLVGMKTTRLPDPPKTKAEAVAILRAILLASLDTSTPLGDELTNKESAALRAGLRKAIEGLGESASVREF